MIRWAIACVILMINASPVVPPSAVADVIPPSTRPANAEPDGSVETYVQATRQAVAMIQKVQDLGEPITPSFLLTKVELSKRLARAEIHAAQQTEVGKHDAERRAILDHLERVRELYRLVLARHDVGSPVTIAIVRSDLAEAKLWLAHFDKGAIATTRPAN